MVNTAEETAAVSLTPDLVTFVADPPGLEGLQRFTLRPLDPEGVLFSLTAAGDESVFPGGVAPRLFLLRPLPYFPSYEPSISDETLAALGSPGVPAVTDNLAVLVVLNPGVAPHETTANLLAPVVVDTTTGRALQVVLDDGSWPLRAPLRAA